MIDLIGAPQDTWAFIRHADSTVSIDPNGGVLGGACPPNVRLRVAQPSVAAVATVTDAMPT